MPMIKCPDCGSSVSDRLSSCPTCGAPIAKKSDRYSQFYQKPQTFLPEPRYEEPEERPRRKKSSKSTALSISAILISFMAFLTSFMAIAIASSKPKEVYVEKEVPVYQEVAEENYEKEVETVRKEENIQDKNDQLKGNLNYLAKEPIFYTFVNSIGNIEYCFIQEIENTGDCPIYLKGCDLNIEDENGHLIATENFISNCPDIIIPGEIGYFYNSIGSTNLNESAEKVDSIKAVPELNIVKSRSEPIEYEISDTSLTKGTLDTPTVIGRVTNNTEDDDSLLYLNVIFYDSIGNVIAITGVNVQNLTSGSTKGFECPILTFENISFEDIENYKVIAQKSYYQF